MNLLRCTFLFITVLVLAVSCDKEKPELTPHIISVQQETSPGEICAVKGYNFGENPGAVTVLFGNTPAEVVDTYDFVIHVYTPFLADGAQADVSVSVAGRSSNKISFTTGEAEIAISSLLEPGGKTIGGFGYDLEINGRGFHPEAAMNLVTFGGVETPVKQASRTSLTVVIPAPASFRQTETEISVKNKATGLTASRTFTYNPDACDSMRVVTAPWIREQLRDGVEYRKASFPLFTSDSIQEIHIVEAVLSAANRIGIGFPATALSFTETSVQAAAAGALVGINAGYFTMDGGELAEYPFVRINGEEKQEGAPGNSKTFRSAVLTFGSNGYEQVQIRQPGTSNQNANAKALTDPNVLVAGPLLVLDNALNTDLPGPPSTSHNVTSSPMSAFGKLDDGTPYGRIVMVAVDGRGTGTGMNCFQLQRFMRYLGAHSAMCLDGGGSTTMYIKGKGVVNVPSDGSERPVQTTLFLF